MVVSHFSIAHAAALFSVVTDYIAVFCCRACDINGQQGRPQRICILEGKSWRIWMIFCWFRDCKAQYCPRCSCHASVVGLPILLVILSFLLQCFCVYTYKNLGFGGMKVLCDQKGINTLEVFAIACFILLTNKCPCIAMIFVLYQHTFYTMLCLHILYLFQG